jgi:DNA-directed RNA polymerase subunit RPC12/RpoP
MIKFDCSKCGRSYRVSDEYAGKRVRCRECTTINLISAVEPKKVGCGDSVAAFNDLLQELLRYEQQAPAMEADA